MVILALALTVSTPSTVAEALGRRLAATGGLETMLPLIATTQVNELVAANPELSESERAQLRETGTSVAAAARQRLIEMMGHEYAGALSIADLRRLVAFNEGAVAARYRAAMPQATMRALARLGNFDLKAQVAQEFCVRTHRLCDR